MYIHSLSASVSPSRVRYITARYLDIGRNIASSLIIILGLVVWIPDGALR